MSDAVKIMNPHARMGLEQASWTEKDGWQPKPPARLGASAQVVLVFGSAELLRRTELNEQIRRFYPAAHIFGCSTTGEIFGAQVYDNTLSITAIAFKHTRVATAVTPIAEAAESYQAGARLAGLLPHPDLVHALVLSEGLQVNGSELVHGLTDYLPPQVTVTGGLAADGSHFKETLVICDGPALSGQVAVLGLYGSRLRVGFGSLGGWDQFGPERLITKAQDNVLYELDGKSALNLYKTYLGEQARELPASGGLFPLGLRLKGQQEIVVRTILNVNEEEQSLTFAGDMPQGAYARLMKANFDRLIDGAIGAAQISYNALSREPDLALLISCGGRKRILRQRIEEEVEGVQEVLGRQAILTGFYSYGEISPFTPSSRCELHNQTMTITTFTED